MKRILVIYGPTAIGKTNLGISLAQKYNGELISADSRQVYKDLDIGTGKVSFDTQIEKHSGYWIVNGVKIHGFDLVEPDKRFSVADFLKHTFTSLIRISEVNRLPIVVGGTGFYIKSLIEGIESIGVKPYYKLRRKLEKLSTSKLYQKLLAIDSKRAQSMNESDRQNPRRLIRAIEIAVSSQESQAKSHKYEGSRRARTINRIENYLLLGLTAPNSYLYSRSDKWLKVRLAHGLIDEVKNLLDQKVKPVWLDNLGLEYRWISRFILGKIEFKKAQERLKGDTHSFIRRQKTWFRQFPNIHLFDISKPSWRQKLEKTIKG